MKDFIGRHIVPVVLIIFGLASLLFLGHLFMNQEVGVNPAEFVLKACGKIFYLGIAWIATHVVVKFFFTTVYSFCHWTYSGNPLQGTSQFKQAWEVYAATRVWDNRITIAVITHVGIFASVCLLLALAF